MVIFKQIKTEGLIVGNYELVPGQEYSTCPTAMWCGLGYMQRTFLKSEVYCSCFYHTPFHYVLCISNTRQRLCLCFGSLLILMCFWTNTICN